MTQEQNDPKREFIYPLAKYRGKFTPQNLAFNANLQEFAQRISFICNLESSGKISTDDAYHRIKQLWKQLKTSKQELLDQPPPEIDDLPE